MSDLSAPLSAEDAKLVTLARATRARTGAAEGAAVRDENGRTYAAATVDLPSLQVSALEVCVAMAVSSGSTSLEAAVVLTEAPAAIAGLGAAGELARPGLLLHVADHTGRKLRSGTVGSPPV